MGYGLAQTLDMICGSIFMPMSRIFLSILLIFVAVNSFSATYYVKNGGDNTKSGTSAANAWAYAPGMCGCSDTCGSTTLQAGDTVYFDHDSTWSLPGYQTNPGDCGTQSGYGVLWIPASGTEGNLITFDGTTWGTGVAKTRATITATAEATAHIFIAGSYITVTGFDVNGNADADTGGIYVLGNKAPIVGSQSNVAIDNCIIHDIGETDQFIYGILIGPQGSYTLSNVTVTNTTVYNTAHEGIAIYPSWNEAGSHPINDTILIRNCIIYNTGIKDLDRVFGEGIAVSNDSRNVTLEYNTISNAFYGIELRAGDHDMTWAPTNVIVRYNIIHGSVLGGIVTQITYGSTVGDMTASFYGNLIYSNGQSEYQNSCFDIDIDGAAYGTSVLNFYNNTIYTTHECTTQRGVITGMSMNITGTPTFNFKNNLLYYSGTCAYPNVPLYETYKKMTASNNLIYCTAGTTLAYIENTATAYTAANITDYDPYPQTNNPLFISTSNFHLQSTSPAINAGANLCATLITATDYDGNPVCSGGLFVGPGTAPEIGAYEYLYRGLNSGGFLSGGHGSF